MHMKIITLFLIFSSSIFAQEIVDETINTQVEASNESIQIQNKIDALDIESKKYILNIKIH